MSPKLDESSTQSLLHSMSSVLKITSSKQQLKSIAADIILNCCIDPSTHSELLSSEETAVSLLFPLIGGEELREEETDLLPVDLQYMEETKEREQCPEIRLKLLQAMHELCHHADGRCFLRDRGAYGVLRVYHLWETDYKTKEMCENVVTYLIHTEEEINA